MTKLWRVVFSKCLVVGWAILIAGVFNLAQAQQQSAPPPPPAPPPPAPVFNPSPSNTTVPQPSYQSISPTTPSSVPGSDVTSPANEGLHVQPLALTRRHPRQKPVRSTADGAGLARRRPTMEAAP